MDSLDIRISAILASAKDSNLDEQIRKLSGQIKERLELKLKIDASDLQVVEKQVNEAKKKIKAKSVMTDSLFINAKVEKQAADEITARLREVKKNVDALAKVQTQYSVDAKGRNKLETATLTYYNKELGQTVTETMKWVESTQKVNDELKKIKTFRTTGLNAVDNTAQAEAIKQATSIRDFNFGNLIQGVNASTFDSSKGFSSYIKEQYGESAELIGKFNDKQLKTGEIITQANFRVKEGADKWRMYQATLNKTTGEMRLMDNGLKDVINRQMSFGKMLSNAYEKFAIWSVATVSWYGAVNAVKSMISTIQDLDSSIVDLQKTTDLAGESLNSYLNKAFQVGSQIGKTGKDVIDATSEFSKAGYNVEQSLELAKSALVMTNVAEGIDDVTEASSALIAVLKGYQMEASKAMDITSMMNEVSNTTATNFDDLADGLRRTAGTVGQTGTQVQELTGLLVGGFEPLRNMEMVSSGLNMISQRLRGIGEDGEAIDGLMPKLQDEFMNIAKISIVDPETGGLRSTYNILKDMATVFPTLTEQQRQYLGELAAGNRQVKVLNSILSNWQSVDKAIQSANNSTGSALKENEKYLNSIEGRLSQLSSAWQKMSVGMIDSDLIKGAISSVTTLINTFGNLQTVLLLIGTTLALWKGTAITSFFTSLGKSVLSGITSLRNYNIALGSTIILERSSATATLSLNMALKSLWTTIKANPLGLILTGVTLVVTAMDIFNQKQEEIKQKAEQYTQKLRDESNALNDLKNQYTEISQSGDSTTESKQRLKSIQDQLIETYGIEANAIDLVNGKYRDQIKVIDQASAKKYEELKRSMGASGFEAQRNLFGNNTTDVDLNSFSLFNPKAYKYGYLSATTELDKVFTDLQKRYSDKFILDDKSLLTGNSTFKVNGTLEDRVQILGELSDAVTKVAEKDKDYEGIANSIANQYSTLNEKLQKNTEIWNKYAEADFYSNYKEQISEVHDLQNQLVNEKDSNKKSAIEQQLGKIQSSIITGKGYITGYKTFVDDLFNSIGESSDNASDGLNSQKQSLESLQKSLDETTKSVESYESELSYLNQTLDDVHKGEKFNGEQINDLLTKYPELSKYIVQVGDSYKIESEGLEILRQIKTDELNTALDAEVQKTKEVILQSSTRLTAYQDEINSIKDLASAQAAISGLDLSYSDLSYSEYIKVKSATGSTNPYKNEEEYLSAQEASKAYLKLGNLYDSIEKRKKLLSTSKFGTSSKNNSSKDPYIESFEKELNNLQYLRDKDKISEAEYYNQLEKLNNKYFLNKKKYLDDYRKYEIEVYSGRKQLAEKAFNDELSQWKDLYDDKKLNIDAYIAKVTARLKSKGLSSEQKSTLQDLLGDLNLDKISLSFKQFDNTLEPLNDKLSELEHQYKMLGDSDLAGKEKNLNEQLAVKQKLFDTVNKQITEYTNLMKSAKTEAEKELYKEELSKLNQQQYQLEEAMIERANTIRIDSINALKDAEQKRHEDVMDNLDDELDRYKSTIDKMIKERDKLHDAEDYQRNIAKQDSGIQAKQNELNALALDNSAEAQARKAQLNAELLDLQEKKEDTVREHTRDQEKDLLNDLLDLKEKNIKDQKKLEDDKYKAFQSNIDKMLSGTQDFYNQQDNISKLSIDKVISYYDNLNKTANGVYDNLITKLKQAQSINMDNPITPNSNIDSLMPSYNNNQVVQMADYLNSNGHKVEWKNNKVHIDGKVFDPSEIKASGIDNIDGHWTGTIEEIKKLLSKKGINFDQGGTAFGKGFMFKDVIEPERTLSPQQTKMFDELVKNLPDMMKTIDITKSLIPNLRTFNPANLINNLGKSIQIDKIETHVYPSQGMDEERLASLVEKKIFTNLNTKLALNGI